MERAPWNVAAGLAPPRSLARALRSILRRWAFALPFLIAAVGVGQERRRFAPWPEAGYPGAESRPLDLAEIYPRGRPALPHRLDATVLYTRGTPWTAARALRQIRLTAAILAPCGISFGRVRLARLRLPAERRRIDIGAADPASGVPAAVAELAALLPPDAAYPAAFLIGRVDGSESLAVSYRARDDAGPRAAYFNTAWIGYRAHWLPRRDDRYSPLAHEFAHLLCRCGHQAAERRHLLHEARNFLSAEILPEHCERFRESPLLAAND